MIRERLDALVGPRGFRNRSDALLAAIERGLAPTEQAAPPATPRKQRLATIYFRVGPEQARRLRTYAVSKGQGSVSEAAAGLIAHALDIEEGRCGVPGHRADELAEGLRALSALLDGVGPPVFGLLHLVAHWASRTGGIKVSEEEVLAEVLAEGNARWEQLLEELQEPVAPAPPAEGGH